MANSVAILRDDQLVYVFASAKRQVEEERKITRRRMFVTAVSLVYRKIMKTADFTNAV